MAEEQKTRVSERFARLLAVYRRPDGSEWGGQDLETATGGAVTRSYVTNLLEGRIGNPGYEKIAAIARAMGFAPGLWFGGGADAGRAAGREVGATAEDETLAALMDEALRLEPRDRKLLLGAARGISSAAWRG